MYPGKIKTISLCMIVKDEEACLERCLKSVRDCVDEIVIVDTGSTDGTLAIADRYGARIYHHPWEGDFSKHRNQSLAYATGDWIFQLDADEELSPGDGPLLRTILKEGTADYYHCQFHDIKQDGTTHGVFYLIRLFRNGMGMRYERKVHNQLHVLGNGAYCRLRVRHYGYDLPKEQMEAKYRRTTTLLKEMLKDDPEDAYSLYQLASSYSLHREPEQAVFYGERALAIMHRDGLRQTYFQSAYNAVANGYYGLGKMEEVERVCREGLEVFPFHLDMCHILADFYFRKRDAIRYREMAERYLGIRKALEEDPGLMGGFYSHSYLRQDEIHFGLACLEFMGRQFDKADALFQQSFAEGGRRRERAERICRLYVEKGLDEKALQWLGLAVEAWEKEQDLSQSAAGDPGPLAYEVAETLSLRKQWPLALRALELALKVAPSLFDRVKFDRLLSPAV